MPKKDFRSPANFFRVSIPVPDPLFSVWPDIRVLCTSSLIEALGPGKGMVSPRVNRPLSSHHAPGLEANSVFLEGSHAAMPTVCSDAEEWPRTMLRLAPEDFRSPIWINAINSAPQTVGPTVRPPCDFQLEFVLNRAITNPIEVSQLNSYRRSLQSARAKSNGGCLLH